MTKKRLWEIFGVEMEFFF